MSNILEIIHNQRGWDVPLLQSLNNIDTDLQATKEDLQNYKDSLVFPWVILSPSGDATGATDTAAIQTVLTAGGCALLRPGNWYINATLTISGSTSIVSIDRAATTLHWVGAVGGKVISTAALAANSQDYTGVLAKFNVVYPSAKISGTSRGIYVAQGNCSIDDVQVATDSFSLAPGTVAGTVGIELDGVLNAGAIGVKAKVAGGQWEHGILVRSNHVRIYDSNTLYVKHGVGTDSDSLGNSANNGPWNVSLDNVHSFEPTGSSLHVIRANSVDAYGTHESPPASGSAPVVVCESTFVVGHVVSRLVNIYDACKRVVSFTTSGKVVDLNPKTGVISRLVGQVSGDALISPPSGVQPVVAAGPALGTAPPAPTILSGGSTCFTVAFGTGTATATGMLFTVTFPVPYQSQPVVLVSPENSGTRGLGIWSARASTTQVSVYCDVAPAASQVANAYHINVLVQPSDG